MKPRDIASFWVKHRPWYWARDRRQPGRGDAKRKAIRREMDS